jgi:hypothetical protein
VGDITRQPADVIGTAARLVRLADPERRLSFIQSPLGQGCSVLETGSVLMKRPR